MRRSRFYCIISLALICLVLTGCSGSKEAEQTKASGKTATEQTVEAIKDYGKKPIDKARATQQLGEDRTKAIDDVTGKQ
jgi:PBP1b-binding outer membrane lipoprotein LpoB